MRAHRGAHHGVSFLQQRAQFHEDGAVKVSVAGVGQPGKSISKRVGRLAQKWCAFATWFRLPLCL